MIAGGRDLVAAWLAGDEPQHANGLFAAKGFECPTSGAI